MMTKISARHVQGRFFDAPWHIIGVARDGKGRAFAQPFLYILSHSLLQVSLIYIHMVSVWQLHPVLQVYATCPIDGTGHAIR